MKKEPDGTVRVYVDAKIVGIHDPALERKAFVGYIIPDSSFQNAKLVNALETDDAEIEAILFAIETLAKSDFPITIVCDHESVVSEATKEMIKKSSDRMKELRKLLQEKRKYVKLKHRESNPAHKIVTEYVNQFLASQHGNKNETSHS